LDEIFVIERKDIAQLFGTLVHSYIDPTKIKSESLGSMQTLPNHNELVDFGANGVIDDFTSAGKLVWKLVLPPSVLLYRAYSMPWSATPRTLPRVKASVVRAAGATTTSITVSWNGATTVSGWKLLAGSNSSNLSPVGSVVPNKAFETHFSLSETTFSVVVVEALDSRGRVLASSAPTEVLASTALRKGL